MSAVRSIVTACTVTESEWMQGHAFTWHVTCHLSCHIICLIWCMSYVIHHVTCHLSSVMPSDRMSFGIMIVACATMIAVTGIEWNDLISIWNAVTLIVACATIDCATVSKYTKLTSLKIRWKQNLGHRVDFFRFWGGYWMILDLHLQTYADGVDPYLALSPSYY